MERAAPGEPDGAFPRPTTRLNRLVDRLLRRSVARAWDPAVLELLQRRGVADLVALGAWPEAAFRAVRDTEWRIAAGRSPSDAWGGEVLRGGSAGHPHVVLYEDSALTRLPGPVFDFAAQLTVDHMLGHLYEYYRGAEDWGEAVACRWQYRLLRNRGGLANNVAAVVVALGNRLHKKIPLSNYR